MSMTFKNNGAKILIAVILSAALVAFFALDLHRHLTLDALKQQQQVFADYYGAHPWQTVLIYLALYVGATALSLPGATLLTLAGGALFGLWVGTVVISFASSIGATLAFLVSRFVLRDYVQKKFADRLRGINDGFAKDGAFYLLSLRLLPVVPFFAVNLLMGLTPMRVSRYYLVSQLGMLPATLVYVNAGTQLGQLQSLRDVASPEVIASLALLGVFPLLAKKLLEVYRTRRVMRGFRKPEKFDYNVVVIGGGSAGLVSAYICATLKAQVALVEQQRMGGDCLNTGCVPSKALIRSARMLNDAQRAQEFGFKRAHIEYDFVDVMERVQRVIREVAPHDSAERYTGLGVECIAGTARIVSPYEVRVGERVLTTRNIIVATGARPNIPVIPGLDKVNYRTSDTIWELRERPRRMLVLGGGPIGCELAQCFARLGSQVTVVQRGGQLLPGEDPDIAELILQRFAAEKIQVLTGHTAQRFERDGDDDVLVCSTATESPRIAFDVVLLALGRKANVSGFGLEELGVLVSPSGTLEADDYLRTRIPNIYACGDVAGPYQFTHMAAHQAWYCAVNALFAPLKKFRVDYRVVPWATFTDPEVARVGINEQEARAASIAYEVTSYAIDDLDRAIADGEAHGKIKVLTSPGSDKILGVTIVGSHAGETIAEFVSAMKHGIGLNKILGTLHIYPTFMEANKYVAGAWKKAHAPTGVLGLLQKLHGWRRG